MNEVSQALSGRGGPFLVVFWRKPPKVVSGIYPFFVAGGSFTADSGLL